MDSLDHRVLLGSFFDIYHRFFDIFICLCHRRTEIRSDPLFCRHLTYHLVDLFRGSIHRVKAVPSVTVYIDKSRDHICAIHFHDFILVFWDKVPHIIHF